MPYDRIDQLPEHIREELPEPAQELYLAAYNRALEKARAIRPLRSFERLELVRWEALGVQGPAARLPGEGKQKQSAPAPLRTSAAL
jgi:hypothetical protein